MPCLTPPSEASYSVIHDGDGALAAATQMGVLPPITTLKA